MNDQNSRTLSGLPRARQIVDSIEHHVPEKNRGESIAMIHAQAAHAQAIAAITQAEATRLAALVALWGMEPMQDNVAFSVDEWLVIGQEIRKLAGFPPIPESPSPGIE